MLVTKLISDVLVIVVFYLNLHRFAPNLLLKGKVKPFFLALLGLFIAAELVNALIYFGVVEPLLKQPFFPKPSFRDRPPGPPRLFRIPVPSAFGMSISFAFVILLSTLIALIQERTRIREEQQQAVIEKVKAELTMLKLQISPHFLFNTLNNISWLARKRSEKTEEAVIQLSQLLRYIIYQPESGPVLLSQEIEHLQHYINLQKMRLPANASVSFTCQGDINYQTIEPLLFIPFVENAFKHGIHHRNESPVTITLLAGKDRILFTCTNTINRHQEPDLQNPGIGIQNTKRRLSLHYPNRHTLSIDEQEHTFTIQLDLQLKS
ncbi:sensor histidine kinase [Arsenicibacter rosenii]|nr:histidine kinase [Arsenicibacter rosenii]